MRFDLFSFLEFLEVQTPVFQCLLTNQLLSIEFLRKCWADKTLKSISAISEHLSILELLQACLQACLSVREQFNFQGKFITIILQSF